MRLSERENQAYTLMLGDRLSTEGLARHLKVSRATAARVVAAMRRKGVPIASVRVNGSSHLEIRDAEDVVRRQYENLRKLIGFAKGRPERLNPEDEKIYGAP